MVTVPLYVFLFAYFAGVLLFGALLVVDLFHLINTGTFTTTSFIVTFGALAGITLIFWGTLVALSGIFWQAPVTIWDNAWFGNVFSTEQIFSPFEP